MYTQSINRLALPLALAATLFCARTAPVSAQPSSEKSSISPLVVSMPRQDDPLGVLNFWTDEQMTKAEVGQADMPVLPNEPTILPGADQFGYVPASPNHENYASDPIARLNGMLFYQQPSGEAAHCSASIIQSHSRSIVLTAAHCVLWRDGPKENAMFVPAYNGTKTGLEKTPLGRWPVEMSFVPSAGAYDDDDDIAVARLYAIHDNGYGTEPVNGTAIEDLVGDGFVPRINEAPETFGLLALYGYPGGTWGHGGKQYECVTYSYPSNTPSFPTMLYTPNCATIPGNSGGPLLFGTSPTQVVSVVHDTFYRARLTEANFLPIFEAAEGVVGARAPASTP